MCALFYVSTLSLFSLFSVLYPNVSSFRRLISARFFPSPNVWWFSDRANLYFFFTLIACAGFSDKLRCGGLSGPDRLFFLFFSLLLSVFFLLSWACVSRGLQLTQALVFTPFVSYGCPCRLLLHWPGRSGEPVASERHAAYRRHACTQPRVNQSDT